MTALNIYGNPVEAGLLEQTERLIKLSSFGGFFSVPENRARFGLRPLAGARSAATHRLVEASKSPTSLSESEIDTELAKRKFFYKLNAPELTTHGVDYSSGEVVPYNPAVEFEQGKQVTDLNHVGCSTVIQFREWSDEWRVRTQVEAGMTAPPTQAGERISELLSSRGAKKIAESCEFMSLKKGGYKTFVTGTFSTEARQRIDRGETTIQKELSRSMDALQKMYTRGWVTSTGEKVAGHSDGLCYCWVVEIPKNKEGGDNPHVHLLMGWRVDRRLFDDWAARIERIWGNGTFHLEKIKDCNCAGAYMAKAAGYLTKAEGADNQGKVRGNRYGISEPARAPDWVTVKKAQLHSMGQIISDIYDHLTVKHGAQYRERARLNRALADAPKEAKNTRQKIGERLQAVRAELKKIPVRCNRYQIILKGYGAASTFFAWAKGEKFTRHAWVPDSLPRELAWQEGRQITAADGQYFRALRRKFQRLKQRRQAITNEIGAALVEQWQAMRDCALTAWEQYENARI